MLNASTAPKAARADESGSPRARPAGGRNPAQGRARTGGAAANHVESQPSENTGSESQTTRQETGRGNGPTEAVEGYDPDDEVWEEFNPNGSPEKAIVRHTWSNLSSETPIRNG